MKKLSLKILMMLVIGSASVMAISCAKDYDDQMKQLEQTVAGNKQVIEEALASEVKVINDQLSVLEQALKDYTDQAKAEMLQQLTDQLRQLKENLETKIDALATSVDGKLSALDGRITSLKESIDAQLLIVGYRLDQIDEKLNLLTTRVSDLEDRAAALEEYRKYVENVLKELAGSIDDLENELADLRLEFETANAERKAEIEANTKLIEENQSAIEELIANLSKLQQDLADTAAALEAKIEQASSDAAEALKDAIELLEQELKEWTDEQLDALKMLMQDQIDALNEAIGNNTVLISANSQDIADLREDLTSAIAEYTLEIGLLNGRLNTVESRVTELGNLYDALKASLDEIENGVLPQILDNIESISDDLQDALDRIQSLENGLSDYYSKTEITRLLQDVTDHITNTRSDLMGHIGDIIDRMDSMLTESEIEALLEGLSDDLNASLGACETRLDDLEQLLAGLRSDVDNLLGRIQSITYVPDYAMGVVYFDGLLSPDTNSVIKMETISLSYLVSPAEVAEEIAQAYSANPYSFSLLTNQVITRAIDNSVVGFPITSITAAPDGMLYVTTLPDIKDIDMFLDSEMNYQVAFKLSTTKGDNRVTQFVDVLKGELGPISLDGIVFTADGDNIITEATDDPNDPLWIGQALKMMDIDIDPLTGVLSSWEGMRDLGANIYGVSIAEHFGLDPQLFTFRRSIAGQYVYHSQSNHQITPKTVSFANGILRSDAAYRNKDYTGEKCMVNLTVLYNGIEISTGNYACVRFVK